MKDPSSDEVASGRRFAFGKNWQRFLKVVNEERVRAAEQSLLSMLPLDSLSGKRFLDVGCGSGLFSLAARRLGASVVSFDYDPQSVACARELKRRYFPEDSNWRVEQGSVLDRDYVQSLGQFDVVYAWGVLHHTGDLWRAMEYAALPVADGGFLYVAVYNDQGAVSRFWRRVKRFYCSGPAGRVLVTTAFVPLFAVATAAVGLLRHGNPLAVFAEHKRRRGMSVVRDWVDWLGGYPFEVAKPEQVLDFYLPRGFVLVKLKTTNRLGCNEFVFQKRSELFGAGSEGGLRRADGAEDRCGSSQKPSA